MTPVVILDNFDSFTWNLYQLIAQLLGGGEKDVVVIRNDKSLGELIALNPKRLVISPGPGRPPENTGMCCEAIKHFAGKIPLLGVCLGHQAIGHVFGGKVVRAKRVMHGKPSKVLHAFNPLEKENKHYLSEGMAELGGPPEPTYLRTDPLFAGVPQGFSAGRYHSLVVEVDSLPDCLRIIAITREDEIMALKHETLPEVYGVQFHPESLLTAENRSKVESGHGALVLRNFLNL